MSIVHSRRVQKGPRWAHSFVTNLHLIQISLLNANMRTFSRARADSLSTSERDNQSGKWMKIPRYRIVVLKCSMKLRKRVTYGGRSLLVWKFDRFWLSVLTVMSAPSTQVLQVSSANTMANSSLSWPEYRLYMPVNTCDSKAKGQRSDLPVSSFGNSCWRTAPNEHSRHLCRWWRACWTE